MRRVIHAVRESRGARAADVGAQAVADVERLARRDAEPLQHLVEDLAARLAQAEGVGDDARRRRRRPQPGRLEHALAPSREWLKFEQSPRRSAAAQRRQHARRGAAARAPRWSQHAHVDLGQAHARGPGASRPSRASVSLEAQLGRHLAVVREVAGVEGAVALEHGLDQRVEADRRRDARARRAAASTDAGRRLPWCSCRGRSSKRRSTSVSKRSKTTARIGTRRSIAARAAAAAARQRGAAASASRLA